MVSDGFGSQDLKQPVGPVGRSLQSGSGKSTSGISGSSAFPSLETKHFEVQTRPQWDLQRLPKLAHGENALAACLGASASRTKGWGDKVAKFSRRKGPRRPFLHVSEFLGLYLFFTPWPFGYRPTLVCFFPPPFVHPSSPKALEASVLDFSKQGIMAIGNETGRVRGTRWTRRCFFLFPQQNAAAGWWRRNKCFAWFWLVWLERF